MKVINGFDWKYFIKMWNIIKKIFKCLLEKEICWYVMLEVLIFIILGGGISIIDMIVIDIKVLFII